MSQDGIENTTEDLVATLEECKIVAEEPTGFVLSNTYDLSLLEKFPKPKFRIPPVFLHKPVKLGPLIRKIVNLGIKCYYPLIGHHYNKICCLTLDDHKALVQYLKTKQLPHHTYGYASKRKMRVVIRGLPVDLDLEELKKQLESVSIPVVRLHKMKNFGHTKDLTMLVLVLVPNNDEGRKILRLQKCFGNTLKIEPPNPRSIQCYRCQKWGHAQRYCNGSVKCVKCAGDHSYQDCDRDPAKSPPKCVNCNADHTSNYKLCPFSPNSPQYKKKMNAAVLAKSMFPGNKGIIKKVVTIHNYHHFLRGSI